MALRYRPEIDGLRAIAVCAVIIYHLKIPFEGGTLLSGGFLGVDLFFVLSGFLITKIILLELDETGRFKLSNFYWRRARRILPPLILVSLFSIGAAWFILLPTEMEKFALSLIAAFTFVSNFFWFDALGNYGAQSALLQPFLHTWSLSIEEQFYVLFPLILLFLYRRGARHWTAPTVAALLLLSFGAGYATTLVYPDLSFFSPVSRAWELLAGSLLAWLSIHRPGALRIRWTNHFMPLLGLLLLGVSFWALELGKVSHPGIVSIPVIVAACLLIWFTEGEGPVTRILSNRYFVAVGKLSYSLYLWHFPIFSFGRLRTLEPGVIDHLAWVALTFVLSAVGYYLVEKPFRFSVKPAIFTASLSATLTVIAGFSIAMLLTDGFRDRLSTLSATYGRNDFDNDALRDQSWSVLDNLAGQEAIGTWNAHAPSKHETQSLWYEQNRETKVLILGNSHSKDVFNALYLNRDQFLGYAFARFGLPSEFPGPQMDMLKAAPNFQAANVILIAPRYNAAAIKRLPQLIRELEDYGKQVVVAGNTAEFRSPVRLPIFDWHILQGEARPQVINHSAFEHETPRSKSIDQQLQEIAAQADVRFVSRRNLMCSDAVATCTLVGPDGMKMMYDYGHWTLDGARYFGRQIADAGWF